MIDFINKKILITGATGAIGRSLVEKFVSLQGNVLATGTKSEKLDLLKKDFPKINILKFDISEHSKIEEFIENVSSQLVGLDILVNNAGITRDSLFMRMKEEQWDEVFNVNIKGVFNCTKNVVRSMIKNKYGKIINVASVAGEMGNPGQANYASTKSGIMGFTKSLAKELGSKNINVNAVSPGFIVTNLTDVLPEETKEKYKELIPLSRFGKPEDVAKAVLFLASDDSSYITGEILRINGGLYT